MKNIFELFFVILAANWASCTISGLTYMDALVQRSLEGEKKYRPGEDPCNPLYWYPRNIPEECNERGSTKAPSTAKPGPLPVPIPVPIPPPMPIPYPAPVPIPMPGPLLPMSPPIPIPPIPYGIPIAPTNPMMPMIPQPYPLQPYPPQPYPPQPYPSQPFPYPQLPYPIPPLYRPGPQVGFVPGLPGLISPDGGINILPFTDAYSDMLEKHKQKMIRKEMERLIDKYDDKYRGYRKHSKGYRRHQMYD